jgi:putative SOS response-associated peptidase YedK
MITSLMCLSDKAAFERCLGAEIDISEFVKLYQERDARGDVLIPKSIDAMFSHPESNEERIIHWLILKWDALQVMRLESTYFSQLQEFKAINHELLHRSGQSLFNQRNLLTASIGAIKRQLSTLQRTGLLPEDHRIYPGMHAPVVVNHAGKLAIQPMRYGRHASSGAGRTPVPLLVRHDAPIHELRIAWADAFGRSHGVVLLTGFYLDPWQRAEIEGRSTVDIPRLALVRDRTSSNFLVPCLWREATDGQESATFAPITDDTQGDLRRAGYQRCLVNLDRGSVAGWLDPKPRALDDLEELLARTTTSRYALAA